MNAIDFAYQFEQFVVSMMNGDLSEDFKLHSYVFGLNGEASEVAELLAGCDRTLALLRPPHKDKIMKEVGDVLHYTAGICAKRGLSFPFVLRMGIPSVGARQDIDRLPLSLCIAAGKATDILKKHLFHGHPADRAAEARAMKDVAEVACWICATHDIDLMEVMQGNIDKLKARYKSGKFTSDESNNRQEDANI